MNEYLFNTSTGVISILADTVQEAQKKFDELTAQPEKKEKSENKKSLPEKAEK